MSNREFAKLLLVILWLFGIVDVVIAIGAMSVFIAEGNEGLAVFTGIFTAIWIVTIIHLTHLAKNDFPNNKDDSEE